MTFNGNCGTAIVSAENGALIGHCLVKPKQNILLGGEAWKVRDEDTQTGRLLVDRTTRVKRVFPLSSHPASRSLPLVTPVAFRVSFTVSDAECQSLGVSVGLHSCSDTDRHWQQAVCPGWPRYIVP